MKHIQIYITIILTILLTNCHSLVSDKNANYTWIHRNSSSKRGKTKIDILQRNDQKVYGYIDSPVIGVSHTFLNGDKTLFSISDGTGNNILGSGVSVSTNINGNVDMLDLDMDGDIDYIIYGDQQFGRYNDNRFAPLFEEDSPKVNGKQSMLDYLRTKNSEQAVSGNRR